MKKYLLIGILFSGLFLFFSCNNTKEVGVEIFNMIASEEECIETVNFNNFLRSHNLALNFSHYSFRNINNEFVVSAFSIDLKDLYIYNATKDNVLKINLEGRDIPHQPIMSLYTHSYDSIFILFENINPRDKGIEHKGKTELVLYDSQMNILNRYNLDKIPYFFQTGDKVLIEGNILNYQSRIFNNHLLFPMAIYSPATSDSVFYSFNPDLLCFIDLSSGAVKTLNVKFPFEDIGKTFDERTSTSSLLYYILNPDSILFSFPHSPKIFLFKVSENKSCLFKKYGDFIFTNSELGAKEATKVFKFHPLVFSEAQGVFLRRIDIIEYHDKKPTYILQVMDRTLNHLGFIMNIKGDDFYISCLGRDIYTVDNTNNTCFKLILSDIQTISISDFEDRYMLDKDISKKEGGYAGYGLPIEQRYKMYLNEIGISDARKVVIINVDKMCSSCVDYLMFSLEKYQNRFDSLRIRYLFIGSDINEASRLLSNYKFQTHVYFDKNSSFKSYFLNHEIVNYHFISIEDNVIKIDSAHFKDFYMKAGEFLEIP